MPAEVDVNGDRGHVDDNEDVDITLASGKDDEEDDLIEELTDLECRAESGLDLSAYRRKMPRNKYRQSMRSLLPVRFDKAPKDELPVANAGFLSLLTYSWLSPIMWKIHKKGTDFLEHMRCPDVNRAEVNAERLEKLWKEELKKKGPDKASFGWTVFRAARTRVIFAGLTFIVSVTFSFSAPAFLLNILLRKLSSGDLDFGFGIALVLTLAFVEFCRTMCFALGWVLNYTTGVRLRGATLSMLYSKILRLRGLKNKTVGEIVNICSNDGQRLFEVFAIGPLLIGGPFILILGIVYTIFLIGPWALVGSATYLAFYPFMATISRLTAYFRRKGIVITDKRVRMMSELLTCIKLIKMYAWEKSFAKTISGIRSDERKMLEKAAYINSISTSAAPMVPVMASVFVITAHVLTGNDLNAAQAFTYIAVLNAMRFSLGVIPYAVRAIADASVSVKRLKAFTLVALNAKLKQVMNNMTQVTKVYADLIVIAERIKSVLVMEELQPHQAQLTNPNYVVVIKKGTFAWDSESNVSVTEKGEVEIKVANGNSKVQNGKPDKAEEKTQLKSDTDDADRSFGTIPALMDITFNLGKGKLVGVCGSVGSGKSSLISAILGRMVHRDGKIAVKGSIAYVSQQAWIMNATVRDNILFGLMYEEEKYKKVVEACCLKEDFEALIAGDETEVGERGINLSGGQKQRVSLARAMYADKDIYLLDDPLSAVDIHIGRHIFTECLMKGLKGKSILFVTHQLQYLSECDSIIVIKDGMISERGKHSELMSHDGEYANLINTYYTQEKDKEEKEKDGPVSPVGSLDANHSSILRDRSDSWRSARDSKAMSSRSDQHDITRQLSSLSSVHSDPEDNMENSKDSGKLMVEEEQYQGKVTGMTYINYMKAAGGVHVVLFVILVYILSIGAQSGSSWWLSYWLQQGGGNTTIQVGNNTMQSMNIGDNPNLRFYALIYGMAVIAMVFLTAFRALLFMKVSLRASSNLHDKNFTKILHCPMRFFDTTPVGRIVNRFSHDLDEIDVRLPGSAEVFLMNILLIIFALLSISYVSPWFLIALVPLVICFVLLNRLFSSGIRDLKRLDSSTRSPMISHMQMSVQGMSIIHAFNRTTEFRDKFHHLVNRNSVPFFLFYSSNRWLAVRLDFLSIVVIAITGVLVIIPSSGIDTTMAGMALAFAIQLTGLFQFTIRMAIETEARFTSVERLIYYNRSAPSEAPGIIKDKRPPGDWPADGSIVFSKVKLRYRENLPLALKGVSFDVLPQEKIGIVGRSGSGKSSLGVCLFRLVELESGYIKIDGIDLSTIGLEDLRSKLAIIPQDPILFIGTIRYNLDPFNYHTDEELWKALEKCHIKDMVASLDGKLDTAVVENGENFSVGERQLMCLARALLRHSKILMLDEATAAIDTETDSLVQTTIKETFQDCTMLIIAHRLNTVLNCNRILVMEDGKVVEYGSPANLMSNPKSKFKLMLDATENQKL
ncbi:hypothetical protein FSP39_025059 [Pinctada imbricata]|uniref:ATP-binding cassette sub-family C member 5 n=1 Tax=Pinctada imbricata TaxID=66713 RepID=A0AA88YAT7_PINIB|nr:hypothetical protein FSP39_025059 [Pinctada imbricata]